MMRKWKNCKIKWFKVYRILWIKFRLPIKTYGGLSDYRSSEGRTVRVKYRGKIKNTILNILGGVGSCTYVGAPSKQLSKCTTFC